MVYVRNFLALSLNQLWLTVNISEWKYRKYMHYENFHQILDGCSRIAS